MALTMLIEGKYSHIKLYQFLFLPVVFTKLFGWTFFLLLENPIEIRKIIKPAFITDFSNRHSRINQQAGSKPQTNINDIVRKILTGTQFKEATERYRSHSYHIGQLIQADLFLIMGINIFLHLLYATTIRMNADFSKRRTWQRTSLFVEKWQFVRIVRNLITA